MRRRARPPPGGLLPDRRRAILPQTMRVSLLRVPAAVLTLALFLATGIGVPVHHHADHDGKTTHLTSGTHGHGATLVIRDMRTERPGTGIDVPVARELIPLPEPPVARWRRPDRTPSTPRGRSPPSRPLPRGPPSS